VVEKVEWNEEKGESEMERGEGGERIEF